MLGCRLFAATLVASAAALSGACKSDLTPDEYPVSAAMKDMSGGPGETPKLAWGQVEWDDSVTEVNERFKGSQPWTGDSYGAYVREDAIDDVLKDLCRKTHSQSKDVKEDEILEAARPLLPEKERANFIIRQISFSSGASRVSVYWLEVNRPDRPSKLVDEIAWSKMAMVRTLYSDPPVSFEKVLEKETTLYGTPTLKEFRSDAVWDWYLKKVDPKVWFLPKKECAWEKSGLCVMLYDWKDPEKPSGDIELIVRNERAFSEFKAKIAERVAKIKANAEQKAKSDEEKALAR